jgi:hypothetical protein
MSDNINYLINKKKLKFNIYILTSFVSEKGMKEVKYMKAFNITFNSNLIYIPKINDYLNDDEISILNSYYTDCYSKTIEEFNNKYLIYFDHKLADYISTIPLFYSGLVPNTYNKEIFNNNDMEDDEIFTELTDDLEIIPLFKNCEKIRNINILTPYCPSTPYKKISNKEFMKKMERKKKQLSDTNIKIKIKENKINSI